MGNGKKMNSAISEQPVRISKPFCFFWAQGKTYTPPNTEDASLQFDRWTKNSRIKNTIDQTPFWNSRIYSFFLGGMCDSTPEWCNLFYSTLHNCYWWPKINVRYLDLKWLKAAANLTNDKASHESGKISLNGGFS